MVLIVKASSVAMLWSHTGSLNYVHLIDGLSIELLLLKLFGEGLLNEEKFIQVQYDHGA